MPEIEMRNLALALVQAVQMWSNPRYKSFLHYDKRGELMEEWFRWFVGAWNVARTIKDGRQALVREYLDRDFRKLLSDMRQKVGRVISNAESGVTAGRRATSAPRTAPSTPRGRHRGSDPADSGDPSMPGRRPIPAARATPGRAGQ